MNWHFWTRARVVDADDCASIDPLLSLYADGMASPAEARAVESHLPGCDDCRESLAWMQATRRALAGRPVVTPPADLRARIAAAIAASSDAPASAPFIPRPARTFTLRPAYATAAALFVVGLVSYGLLHPTSQVAVRPLTKPTKVAALPPAPVTPPLTRPGALDPPTKLRVPIRHVRPTRPVLQDLSRVANSAVPEEAPPEPVQTTPTAQKTAKVKATTKSQLPLVKKPVRPQTRRELLATNKPAVSDEHKVSVVKHEDRKPEVVATVTPPPVPVSIAPTIIKQDPAPIVEVVMTHEPRIRNADLLDSVRKQAGNMRTVALKAIVLESGRSNTSATRFPQTESKVSVPAVYTP